MQQVVVFVHNASTEVLQTANYYPFGMKHTASSPNSFDNLYGYNGIEEVNDFGLEVNMATFRTLDPALGRWWQVDPQAESLMGLSPYNSMNNSPIMHSDPQGDSPILIGAAIGFLSNGIGNIMNGQNFFKGGLQAAAIGAIGGGISSGIGAAAQGLANAGLGAGGVAAFQAGAHAISGGVLSAAQGGNFWHGAAAGGISSGVSSGIGLSGGEGLAQWVGGGASGGIGSAIAGGSFWDGAAQGLITGGLNHAAEQTSYLLTKRRLITMLKKEGFCTTCTHQEVGEIFQNQIVAPSLLKEGIPIVFGQPLKAFFGKTVPDFFVLREGNLGTRDFTGLVEVKAKYAGRRVGLYSQNGQIFKQILGLSAYMASRGYAGGKHAIVTTGGVKVSSGIYNFGRAWGIRVHHFQARYSGSLSSGNVFFR